jgi:hypothetical protein
MKKLICLLVFLLFADTCLAGVSVTGKLTRTKSADPGETYEGVIILKNTGKSRSQVKIYQTDYHFTSDGTNLYGNPGTMPRSNGSWITFTPNLISIPPNDTSSVYYTVKLPEDTSLKGTYWSMLMVEPMSGADPQSLKDREGKAEMGIQVVIRYGVQIVTEIGNTGVTNIRFLDKKLVQSDTGRVLQLDIENTGERRLRPLVWAELYNTEGINIGRFESEKKLIYPDCSVRHSLDLTDVPNGDYKALIIVDNGDENLFGAQYNLNIE